MNAADANETAEKRPGRIFTFYSYKGGTGRTMALANVAWILASAGKRVLAIDWDLEAPGLHRYYHPFLADPQSASTLGLIDFLLEFVAGAQIPHEQGAKWFEEYANLMTYAVPLNWDFPEPGLLDLVTSGRQDGGYASRVTLFDWQGFYEKLGGGVFLEAVRRNLRRDYDYILIDSRTGMSDTSGICSVQMPDELVCCFTLNSQSIQGAGAAADSAFQQRLKPSGEPGLKVWPVPTRVDSNDKEKVGLALDAVRQRFLGFLNHLSRSERPAYFDHVHIPYETFYAYEEVLATIADRPGGSAPVLGAMERLTTWLTAGEVKQLTPAPEQKRIEAKQKFARRPQAPLKIFVALNVEEEAVRRLEPMIKVLPRWYMKTAYQVFDVIKHFGVELDAVKTNHELRSLVRIMVERFGEGNITVRGNTAEFIATALGIDVGAGSVAEADAVLVPLTREWLESPPVIGETLRFELEWATQIGTPIFPVELPSTRPVRFSLPKVSSRGLHSLSNEDFGPGVALLEQSVLETVAHLTRPQLDPDDPQKGRWGGLPERHARRLSAVISPISDEWFNVVLRVDSTDEKRPLKGDVWFHLHPTFQPPVMRVAATSGSAQVELRAWGAFTVGAVTDLGATALELDLATLSAAPAVFLNR